MTLLVYDIQLDRWTYTTHDVVLVAEYLSTGFNLDQLDEDVGGPLPADIDQARADGSFFLVDSPEFLGGDLSVIAFDSDGRTLAFTGAPLIAELETREWRGFQAGRLLLSSSRPHIEGGDPDRIEVQAATRDRLSAAPARTPFEALDSDGEVRLRVDARYARLRVRVQGVDFDHATGVEVEQRRRTGRR